MPKANKPDEFEQFAADLQLMKHRAISRGLHATGQRLDSAIRTLGFEIAGNSDGCSIYEPAKAIPKPLTALYAKGRISHRPIASPCPDCGSSELEMRTYGGSTDDADSHCAQCGKLIHRAWSPA
jgi:hypothetical protein